MNSNVKALVGVVGAQVKNKIPHLFFAKSKVALMAVCLSISASAISIFSTEFHSLSVCTTACVAICLGVVQLISQQYIYIYVC